MNKATKSVLVALGMFGLGATAMAHVTGTGTGAVAAMDTLLIEIISWIQGPLGLIMAIAALAVGLGIGIVQQSLLAVVLGVAFAAVINYGPDILTAVSGASESAAV